MLFQNDVLACKFKRAIFLFVVSIGAQGKLWWAPLPSSLQAAERQKGLTVAPLPSPSFLVDVEASLRPAVRQMREEAASASYQTQVGRMFQQPKM